MVPPHERRLTAYHEAGHAVMHHCLASVDPVHSVTIIPRGQAGGMTISLPGEDRGYYSRRYMEEEIAALLGGRTAEELFLGDISTGASNDLQRASAMARRMVTAYGMSERLGAVSYDSGHDEVFIGRSMAQAKSYSEEVGRPDRPGGEGHYRRRLPPVPGGAGASTGSRRSGPPSTCWSTRPCRGRTSPPSWVSPRSPTRSCSGMQRKAEEEAAHQGRPPPLFIRRRAQSAGVHSPFIKP